MKRNLTIILFLLVAFEADAQPDTNINQREIFEVTASIVLATIAVLTLLTIIKRYLDFRLKNKLIDKGISETIVASMLSVDPNDARNSNIKWFLILLGIGTALTIIYYTLPLGIHSVAIMAFTVSLSFLAHYFFLKRSGK